MDKNISFLIGAGFSIPAGFPSAKLLGKRIIAYGTHIARERRMGLPGHNFLEHYILAAIKFYIRTNPKDCNYEDFLDFLYETNTNKEFIDFLRGYYPTKHIDIEIDQSFIDNNFLNGTDVYLDWVRNCIRWPDNIENKLHKYDAFTRIITSVPQEITINLHTTNHDQLLEYMSDRKMFGRSYLDGFTAESKYYYLNSKRSKIICPFYDNNYSGNLKLYKLHGSLTYYYFHTEEGNGSYIPKDFIKTHFDFDEFNLYEDREGEKPAHDPINYLPVFLTGRKTKARQYLNRFYFQPCLQHFSENLSKSKILIAIGFSFNDIELVKIIQENLPEGVPCIIVDPFPSEAIKKFAASRSDVTILEKGIEAISAEELGLSK